MAEEPTPKLTDEEKRERLRTQKREYMRRWVAANRDKKRVQNRESYARNRETQLAKKKEWRDQHPGYFKRVNAEWYQRNREVALIAQKAYRDTHKDQIRETIAKWYKNNPEKVQVYRERQRGLSIAWSRLKRTGCTAEQYGALYAQQQGLCAICRQPPGKYALAADHCHQEQVVRGLLCVKCNSILGMANDDMNILAAAIEYLQQYQPMREGHDLATGQEP